MFTAQITFKFIKKTRKVKEYGKDLVNLLCQKDGKIAELEALGPDVLFQYELDKKNNEITRSLLKSYNGTV